MCSFLANMAEFWSEEDSVNMWEVQLFLYDLAVKSHGNWGKTLLAKREIASALGTSGN